jgi:hypothetical protein
MGWAIFWANFSQTHLVTLTLHRLHSIKMYAFLNCLETETESWQSLKCSFWKMTSSKTPEGDPVMGWNMLRDKMWQISQSLENVVIWGCVLIWALAAQSSGQRLRTWKRRSWVLTYIGSWRDNTYIETCSKLISAFNFVHQFRPYSYS